MCESSPFNVRFLHVLPSAALHHHILFYSPSLNRLVVPWHSNGKMENSVESAVSVSNTRTKVRNPEFLNTKMEEF